MFFKQFLNDDDTVKKVEEIRKICEEKGIDLNKEQVYTCGVGISATMLWACLDHAGCTKGAVYDGSWVEYVRIYRENNMFIECKEESQTLKYNSTESFGIMQIYSGF
jgi:3-mercaptopyruvate sulfurtransferase SseA